MVRDNEIIDLSPGLVYIYLPQYCLSLPLPLSSLIGTMGGLFGKSVVSIVLIVPPKIYWPHQFNAVAIKLGEG